jgi:hypothetical protein
MDSRELLSMGETARRSGFAASALRFYDHGDAYPGWDPSVPPQ